MNNQVEMKVEKMQHLRITKYGWNGCGGKWIKKAH
jgi:hypothetical protein